MTEKILNTRIINKHETEENWLKSSFIPKQGEIIVYDVDNNYSYERMKIGDGVQNVNQLPFVDAGSLSGAHLSTVLNSSNTEIPTSKAILDYLDTRTYDENDAMELIAEMGLIEPTVDENGAVYIDENGVIYTL